MKFIKCFDKLNEIVDNFIKEIYTESSIKADRNNVEVAFNENQILLVYISDNNVFEQGVNIENDELVLIN